MSCIDAGTAQGNSSSGRSKIVGDNGAIFHAWLEAKKMNLLPENDKIPISAMKYIAEKEFGITVGDVFPPKLYNDVLEKIEVNY